MKVKHNILVIALILFFLLPVFAQEARKIDEFGNISCDDWMGRTDALAAQIQFGESSNFGYIVVYEGMYSVNHVSKKSGELLLRKYLPQEGEAVVRGEEIRSYLTNHRGVPSKNYMVINAGFRREYTVELWLSGRKGGIPKLKPELLSMKYRRGIPRFRCLSLD